MIVVDQTNRLKMPDFTPPIHGQTLDNEQLCQLFRCGPQGGMRRSIQTNTLVLISNHVKNLYDDRWVDGVFHYTGMGQTGDQSLSFMQNKTLAESASNAVELHLFEVFKQREYVYQGTVKLTGEPYQEEQTDAVGLPRQVWVFPLTLVATDPTFLPLGELTEIQAQKEQKAAQLPMNELRAKALKARTRVGQRTTTLTSFIRDPYLAAYVKRRAMGKCQLCDQPAPFNDAFGNPYLECHHIEWLSQGGADDLKNAVALCPNCHRKMHIQHNPSDVLALQAIAKHVDEPEPAD